jgi:1,4-alpha-glucan branching enzyme
VGYQFNHGKQATADFTKRVINHWLTNYHIDGYRFDLAKGFTPTNTCDASGNNCDVGKWGNYDAARVAIWDTIYNQQQAASPGSYCILEMFADNSEQTVEANYGMLIWGNENYAYNQATMGYSGSDFSSAYYTANGWNQPNMVTYQESHDEERLMWKNEQYGNSSGGYSVKDTATGLKRNAMAAAFWAMEPGPVMLWEFGELGYDYSINTCADGVTVNPNCRTDPKPLRWSYLQDARRKNLLNVYQALLRLRNQPAYLSTFTTGSTLNYSTGGNFKWLSLASSALNIVVVGNFDVVPANATVTFPAPGQWYSYLTDTSISVTNVSYNITLQPGEYYVFTSINLRALALPVQWLNFSAQ